jgi:hypothetical protein
MTPARGFASHRIEDAVTRGERWAPCQRGALLWSLAVNTAMRHAPVATPRYLPCRGFVW